MNTWWLVLISLSRSDSATTGFGQRIPVLGRPVGGDRDRAALVDALGDQLVEAVGLSGSGRQAQTWWTSRPAAGSVPVEHAARAGSVGRPPAHA
jgi:hypothetical protein